jgi:hypothetical protein
MNKGGSCSAIRAETGPNNVNGKNVGENFRNHTEVPIRNQGRADRNEFSA